MKSRYYMNYKILSKQQTFKQMTQPIPPFLYYWSPIFLDKLIPKNSTHWKEWVYATIKKEIAVAFIANNASDFDFAREYDDNRFQIIERYPWAFDTFYQNISWYLYTLDSVWFEWWRTWRSPELVSESEIIPLKTELIENIGE